MKKLFACFLSTAVIISSLALAVSAADNGDNDAGSNVVEYDVTEYGAIPNDNKDDSAAINIVLAKAKTSEFPIVVKVPAGQYDIGSGLNVFSNTTISLDEKAVFFCTVNDTAMLFGRHMDDSGNICKGQNCTHGGYTQIQNVTIEGGTWDRNKDMLSGTNTIITIRHGENITIRNTTLKNGTEHFANVSACKNVLVENVIFKDQYFCDIDLKSYWQNYKFEDPERGQTLEVLHTDYTSPESENSDLACPLDETTCSNVTAKNCTFDNVFCGVGNHHVNSTGITTDLTIENCTFNNVKSYIAWAVSFDGVTIKDNEITNCIGIVKTDSTKNIEVSGNKFSPSQTSAKNTIFLVNTTNGTVTNNEITSSGLSGIRIDNSTLIETSGNKVSNAKSPSIFYSGSTGSIYGNEINNGTAGALIRVDKCSGNVNIKDNTLDGGAEHGIYVSGESVVKDFSGNSISNVKSVGIRVDNSIANISNNNILTSTSNAMSITTNSKVVIDSNLIDGSEASGILVSDSESNITSNRISNIATHAIIVKNETGRTGFDSISHNEIKVIGAAGIYLDNVKNFAVDNNSVLSCDNNLINAVNGSDVEITNNTIGGSKMGGIRIDSSTATISNNEISATTSNGISATTNSEVKINDNTINGSEASGIVVIDGKALITGNKLSKITAHAIYVKNASTDTPYNKISNNEVNSANGAGILVETSNGFSVDENTLLNTGSTGLYFKGSEATANKNTITTCAGNSVFATEGAKVKLTNNIISGADKAGVVINADAVATITGNKISDIKTNSIVVQNSTGVSGYNQINNNVITNSTNSALYFDTTKNYVITGNEVTKTGSHGIVSKNNSTITFTSNTVTGTTGHAIYAVSESSYPQTITLKENKFVTSGSTSFDIRLADYVTCVNDKNTLGTRGLSKTDSVKVTTMVANPVLSKAENANGGIQFTWKAVTGAKNYRIFRKTGTGSWVKLADTTAITYLDTTALSGTTYTYTVRCLSDDKAVYTSDFDTKGLSVLCLSSITPTLSDAANGVTIKWTKVTGATGYVVYRKTSSTSYAKIATITSGSTVAYTDTTAKAGTAYTYAVRATNGTTTGLFTAKSIVFLAPITPVVAMDATGVSIKWNKIAGATGYIVYRKTSSTSYAKIATITSGSTVAYIDKTAKSGTTYAYAVRATNGSSVGMFTAKSILYLAPITPVVANDKTGVSIKWTKIAGATGYIVYRKTSTTSYAKIATITNGSTVSFIDTKASSGTAYTYAVRATNGSYTGMFTAKSILYLKAVTPSSVTSSTAGVTIKWPAVTGAKGYYVYRKTGTGAYAKIATITSGSTVSFLDKGVKGKKGTYTYAVRAYNGSYSGLYIEKSIVLK